MSGFDPSVLDLALYFCGDDNTVSSVWVPPEVYTAQPINMDDVWTRADLYEQPVGSDSFYVLNLSRLLGPGGVPESEKARPGVGAPSRASGSAAEPGPRDLVVIPPNDPNHAYLVKRAVYTDPQYCPPIANDPSSADLDFMALNEGAVLANLPKASAPSGWTCFLLSLLSLKSGAIKGAHIESRIRYFDELKKHMRGRDAVITRRAR